MKKVISVNPAAPDPDVLSFLAGVLRKGGVIAYPTDTLYGLGANPFDRAAVDRLFKIKGRDYSKPILLLISSLETLNPLVRDVSSFAEKIIKAFWPGSLTLIFKASPSLPDLLTAGTGKIGLRLPEATLPIRLIDTIGFPLTATSANLSGAPPAKSASEIEPTLISSVDHILDGGVCSTIPSTVLDVSVDPPRLLREGKISAATLSPWMREEGCPEPRGRGALR